MEALKRKPMQGHFYQDFERPTRYRKIPGAVM
jgi:hypothetical protein